jgi:phosphoribosylamine--glycine ligase
MRVLGIGEYADLGSLYVRLLEAGHDVRVHIADPESGDVMEGLVERAERWEDWLPWVGDQGLIVFEGASFGETQDRLRADGFTVVGGSAFGDRLELDRAFGQETFRELGLRTAATHAFGSFAAAMGFVRQRPRRYVLEYSGSGFASTRTYIGMRDDGSDTVAALGLHQRGWRLAEAPALVLQDHVPGVEVGVGAFFDGRRFLEPANLDWEHKRFFPGDLGELTGEMGTVVTYRGAERLYAATLARLAPQLAASGYRGYVNLNTIVDERGVWPLELTCRFGYPGFAILEALHRTSWGDLLLRVGRGEGRELETHDGFSVGVVLTVPPFPYHHAYDRIGKGSPVLIAEGLDGADLGHLHFGEMKREAGQLRTAGQIGYAMVVTGRGATIEEAQADAYARVDKVTIPNVRYRNDIGDRLRRQDLAQLRRLGWLA